MKKTLVLALILTLTTSAMAQDKSSNLLQINPRLGLEFSSANDYKLNGMVGANLGIDFIGRIPISSDWSLKLGLCYKWADYLFTNPVKFDATTEVLDFYVPTTNRHEQDAMYCHTIELPILLDMDGFYFGTRLGYNFAASYVHEQCKDGDPDNWQGQTSSMPLTIGKSVNPISCSIVLGMSAPITERWITSDFGVELFFNVIPTMIALPDGQKPFHFWGFSYFL